MIFYHLESPRVMSRLKGLQSLIINLNVMVYSNMLVWSHLSKEAGFSLADSIREPSSALWTQFGEEDPRDHVHLLGTNMDPSDASEYSVRKDF